MCTIYISHPMAWDVKAFDNDRTVNSNNEMWKDLRKMAFKREQNYFYTFYGNHKPDDLDKEAYRYLIFLLEQLCRSWWCLLGYSSPSLDPRLLWILLLAVSCTEAGGNLILPARQCNGFYVVLNGDRPRYQWPGSTVIRYIVHRHFVNSIPDCSETTGLIPICLR